MAEAQNVVVTVTTATPRAVGDAPIDLAILKDDLGIDPADTSQDAWLQRRVNGVWARMETYTARSLRAPPVGFVDDWGELILNDRYRLQPPSHWVNGQQRGSVFLRQFPVISINAIELNGAPVDPSHAMFDAKTGKLFDLTGAGGGYAFDLGRLLPSARAKVTYVAGWSELPDDLYEVLLGAIGPMWNSRTSQASGLGGGNINEVQVLDVGSFKMSGANMFVSAANKGTGAVDPILGPYTATLDNYVDWRMSLGLATFPTTVAIGMFAAMINSFNMPPPDNATLMQAVTLDDVSWITLELPIAISGFGKMRVDAIDVSSPVHTLRLANYGAPGVAPEGTPIPRGSLIVPGV